MKQRRAQEEREQARLLRNWLAWHREQRKTVLAGPDGVMFERLLVICNGLPESRAILFAFVKGVPWHGIGEQTRYVVLREIDAAIIKHRGPIPFDDPADDRPNMFFAIKEILFPSQEAPPGAEPGLNSSNPKIER